MDHEDTLAILNIANKMIIGFFKKARIEEGLFLLSQKKSFGLLPFEIQMRKTFVMMHECDENDICELHTLLNEKNAKCLLPSIKVKVLRIQERR